MQQSLVLETPRTAHRLRRMVHGDAAGRHGVLRVRYVRLGRGQARAAVLVCQQEGQAVVVQLLLVLAAGFGEVFRPSGEHGEGGPVGGGALVHVEVVAQHAGFGVFRGNAEAGIVWKKNIHNKLRA